MLQARGFDRTADPVCKAPPHDMAEENPFPHGWRYVKRQLPGGSEIYDQVPLTVEDLLNPQLGDKMPQSDEHQQLIFNLMGSLKTHYAKDPSIGVFSDLIMDWGIPGLAKPAPDIAIVPHLRRTSKVRSIFKVVNERTRPNLIIEVMSPNYPGDDTNKVTIYAKAGVPEYFLIKPYQVQGVPHYKLFGYQLEAGEYRRIPAGDVGPLISHTLQLRFEVIDQGRQVQVTDLRTGKPLLTPIEIEEARQQEQQARLEAEALAKEAEALAQAEVQARTKAEAARLEAEAHAQALEQRLRELEELLKSRS